MSATNPSQGWAERCFRADSHRSRSAHRIPSGRSRPDRGAAYPRAIRCSPPFETFPPPSLKRKEGTMLLRALLALAFVVLVHVLAYQKYKKESERLTPEE